MDEATRDGRHRGVVMTGSDGIDGPRRHPTSKSKRYGARKTNAILAKPAHVREVDVLFGKRIFA